MLTSETPRQVPSMGRRMKKLKYTVNADVVSYVDISFLMKQALFFSLLADQDDEGEILREGRRKNLSWDVTRVR